MAPAEYRIESNQPLAGRFLPLSSGKPSILVSDRGLAVALAAKGLMRLGQEVRVVHVPTGEIVFRKAETAQPSDATEDA